MTNDELKNADASTSDTYDYIGDDFSKQKSELEKQIIVMTTRQSEIQNHILAIEQNISFLNSYIAKNKEDQEKQRVGRGAISKNIELLAKLYQVYREFEDTKVRYYKNISDDTYRFHHLISVDIRRIDEKFSAVEGGDFFGVIKEMMNLIQHVQNEHGGKIPLTEDLQGDLVKTNPEYDL
jgi:hypothetical protein